jgi:hypothetical protein
VSLAKAASKRVANNSAMPCSFFPRWEGVATELHLTGVGVDAALGANRPLAVLLDQRGGIGVELTLAFAADH